MGLEQSHQQAVNVTQGGPNAKMGKPSGSTSPRPSISSDSDIPYISYTINRPIGESPKLQSKRGHHKLRSNSQSPNRSPLLQRPRSMTGHDIIVVKEATPREEKTEEDPELCRLQCVPTFLPIMRGALNMPMVRDPDILDKLEYQQVYALACRYEQYIKLCADGVAAEQSNLAARIREIDFAISTLVSMMTERHKKYVKYSEKFGKVHEISITLDKCQLSLNDTIEKMEALNALLPTEEQLEPFVWTTG